jgi:L-threonylcarbamoyladenylate synthase
MKTKIISSLDLSEAIALLQKGEPVAFPTETVYGLGAPVFDPEAILRVFALKGRPHDNPLIVHIAQLQELFALTVDLPPDWERLAEAFWPGPLTLVLSRSDAVPSIVSAGHPTIAVRMPSHDVARRLIQAVGQPLVAPSANLSGRPSPTCASDVLEDLEGRVALIIDGGECSLGIESTVLSLASPTPTLLRPGSISQGELEQVLGHPIAKASLYAAAHSPGMKYRHYAPRAQIRFVENKEKLKGPFILSAVPLDGIKTRSLKEKTLYAELREADRMNVDVIEVFGLDSISAALRDRISRAASRESDLA